MNLLSSPGFRLCGVSYIQGACEIQPNWPKLLIAALSPQASTTWNCQAWIMKNMEEVGFLQVSSTVKESLQAKRQNWQLK